MLLTLKCWGETVPMNAICFDCATKIASRSWPIKNEDGSSGVPEIPELVNGICPVCEGSKPLDPEDLEGYPGVV